MFAPADVNLTSAVFFCVPARRCGHSLGKLRPTPHHRRKQDVGSPRSHRRDRSEGALHTGRHLSPPSERTRQTGRRAARSAHVAAAIGSPFPPSAEGVSARKREAGRKRAGRSKKQGAFVGKCGENHGKRGAFSRRCVAYVVRTNRHSCDDRAGKKKRSALFLQRKRADRSFIGTLRTTAADSRER